jgi:GntR family transcriptional regulator
VLSAATSLPLYAQIALRLRQQIEAGKYPPESRIPSEHELAAQFQVGRPTVRQATLALVQERVLERRRGSGTYVALPPAEVDLLSAGGTLSSFARSGIALESRVLGRARRQHIVKEEGGPFAGGSAFFVARKSTLDGVPVLLEEMYFDTDVFPALDQHDLNGRSLSQLARERYLLHPLSVEQRFSVISLDRERARSLELEPRAPLLLAERTLHFAGAPRALFARLYCRTDQLLFSQHFALDAALPSELPRAARLQPKRKK